MESKSDFLDRSNPHRILAFFQWCEAANTAATAAKWFETQAPAGLRRMMLPYCEQQRRRCVAEAFSLLNGGEIKAALLLGKGIYN